MKPTTCFLSITLLTLSLYKLSYSQNNEVPFVLSPFIGDTLDLTERNYYGLYQDFNGFHHAVISVSEDGTTLLTRISYSSEGRLIDTLITQNVSYKGNLLALVRNVDNERNNNWQGAREITLTDINGNIYTGSFFDLEKDRLYITSARLADYSQVIKNYRIFNKGDVKSVFIPGGGLNMGSMVGYGFLFGAAMGAIRGFADGDDKSGSFRATAGEKALVWGILFGAAGAVVGLIISPMASTADKTITINTDEDFYGLARFLKNKDINTLISRRNQ
jgi:hypothetical protein